MTTSSPQHESYLLRLWRAQGAQPWRAWVQCAVSGEVVRFASPEALCAYLTDGPPDPVTAPVPPGDPADTPPVESASTRSNR